VIGPFRAISQLAKFIGMLAELWGQSVDKNLGTRFFTGLANRDVKVSILTNSLAATDVALVHSGYVKNRKALLKCGVTLYELRRLTSYRSADARGSAGSSEAPSLHAKTFSVDGDQIFIGRSISTRDLIDSEAQAQRTEELFAIQIPETSYRVHLTPNGHLYWTTGGPQPVRHTTEPGSTFFQLAAVWFLSLLPIEWLL
jgi:putative cardiolipin synthase